MLHELLGGIKPSSCVRRKVDECGPSGAWITKTLRLCNATKSLWKVLTSDLAPYGGKTCLGDGLFLLVKVAKFVFEVTVNVAVVESWL